MIGHESQTESQEGCMDCERFDGGSWISHTIGHIECRCLERHRRCLEYGQNRLQITFSRT